MSRGRHPLVNAVGSSSVNRGGAPSATTRSAWAQKRSLFVGFDQEAEQHLGAVVVMNTKVVAVVLVVALVVAGVGTGLAVLLSR
jgi:hypothetical protein